jgi:heat shock protein HtpX
MSENYFTIDTELSSGHLEDALDFIRQYYLLPQPDAFKNVTKTLSKGLTILSYTAIDKKKNWEVKVDVEAVNPLKVRMTSDLDIPGIIKNLKEELFIAVQLFEDTIRQATLYFAWVEGKDIIPEKAPNERRKFSIRMFGTNMILIYILFFGVNIILFLLLGLRAAIIAIILLQVVIVLLSDRILSRTSDWKITPENPKVHILEYQLPLEKYKMFQEKYGKDMIVKMKKEIYQKSLAEGRVPSCELGEDVFQKYGFHCNAQEKVSKVIDVYSIVKTAAEKFNLPMPRVAISNTMIPNAAATGPSPSRGLVLITTGLLVQLEEDEVLAVLGHEMGHLAGRDPIILLSIISLEFILRFTVFLPIVLLNPFLYIIVVLGIIFFIAKFFETRADLLSAIKIGTPEVLAEALRKIGYQRLHAERVSPTRFPTWINYDPHPPIYFRIDRLERMKTPVYVKNPLLKSARDVFSGFRRSLSNR